MLLHCWGSSLPQLLGSRWCHQQNAARAAVPRRAGPACSPRSPELSVPWHPIPETAPEHVLLVGTAAKGSEG